MSDSSATRGPSCTAASTHSTPTTAATARTVTGTGQRTATEYRATSEPKPR